MRLANYKQAEHQFPADIVGHTMTVLRDEGLYRHLRFARPGTSNMSFDIVTWPGHLAYTGDMGDYVFARLPDMFQFFREPAPNYGYWAEKVLAQDKVSGVRQYSPELAREFVQEQLESGDAPGRIRERALDIDYENGAARFYDSMQAVEWRGFDVLSDADINEFAYHYVWCCNALVWAIQQYDLWQDQQRIAQ